MFCRYTLGRLELFVDGAEDGLGRSATNDWLTASSLADDATRLGLPSLLTVPNISAVSCVVVSCLRSHAPGPLISTFKWLHVDPVQRWFSFVVLKTIPFQNDIESCTQRLGQAGFG